MFRFSFEKVCFMNHFLYQSIAASSGLCYNKNGFPFSTKEGIHPMSQFLYETHMHTSQASACGKSPGRDYIQRYIDAGYAGIIITDHFFRGNCGVDPTLPWKERVRRFCSGFEDAREEGEKRRFPVFFGWEERYDGDEFLIYGLDQAWMLEHPEMERWTRGEQFEQVHSAGGCVVQAHPFRERSYIHTIHLSTGCVDAVEGVNSDNSAECNGMGLRYAALLGLPVTAGSDNHCAETMKPELLSGVVFDHPLTDVHDYVRAIRQKEPFQIHGGPRMEWNETIQPHTPVEFRGPDDRVFSSDLLRFMKTGAF